MNKIVIIDGDNMLHRSYHKYGGFTTLGGKPSSMIFGFPYMVRTVITKLKPTKLYVVFDGGSSPHRKEILPTYKAREQKLGFDYENFQDQKKVVRQLMIDLALTVVWEKGYEADDLIYTITRKHRGDKVCIVSGDKDFHQLISETVSVYSPHKEIELTIKNLNRYFPYQPTEVVDYLCLIGDKSDHIPGYGGIGEVRARQFLDKFGSIHNFLQTYNPSMGKTLDPIKLHKLFKQNRLLIDLKYYYLKHHRKRTKLPIINPTPILKLAAVAMVSREYEVKTLTKVEFISVFKKLANV